jgi:hypothetical protein
MTSTSSSDDEYSSSLSSNADPTFHALETVVDDQAGAVLPAEAVQQHEPIMCDKCLWAVMHAVTSVCVAIRESSSDDESEFNDSITDAEILLASMSPDLEWFGPELTPVPPPRVRSVVTCCFGFTIRAS